MIRPDRGFDHHAARWIKRTFSENARPFAFFCSTLTGLTLDIATPEHRKEFAMAQSPIITTVTPTIGAAAGGLTAVTITGTDFTGATAVNFGATAVTTFTVNPTGTQITIAAANQPAGTGIVNVTVTTPVATSNAVPFTFGPYIAKISPTSGPAGGGSQVIITGTGFTGVTGAGGVTFGGVNATAYTVNSDTQITATTPAHAAGAAAVVVTHPTNGASNSVTYTYTAATISISPNQGPLGGGTTVTLTGTFTGATTANTTVNFGSKKVTPQTATGTTITAVSPAGSGTVSVTVTSPGGTSAPVSFFYVATPTLTSVSGSTGPALGATSGGNGLTLTGTSLATATSVTFNGVNAVTPKVVSDTQLVLSDLGGADGASPLVGVTTVGGSANGQHFTYVAAPTVTSVSPNTGAAAGGDAVLITGSGFTNLISVEFGPGNLANTATVIDDTQISLNTPPGAAGAVTVIVTTVGGSDTTQTYTYV